MSLFWGDDGRILKYENQNNVEHFYGLMDANSDKKALNEWMKAITEEIFEYIEETLEKSESVLVHSIRGQSRASVVIAFYLMKKYRWTLLKTLEFLNSRRPDLEIRATFIQQLNMFETYLIK